MVLAAVERVGAAEKARPWRSVDRSIGAVSGGKAKAKAAAARVSSKVTDKIR